jgi:iron complex transport system substrate-binding protein
VLALLLLAAALQGAAVPPAQSQPVTITDDRGRRLELTAPPQRIVSLLPSLTETLCELGACERLVGIDQHSNWPPQVSGLPRLGGLDDVRVEQILRLKPDLVVAARSLRALDRLESLGLKVAALEPDDWRGMLRVAQALASAIGNPKAAATLEQRLEAGLRQAAAAVPPAWQGATLYVEVASTPYAAGEASYIGALLARLGLRNIVGAELGVFPPLSPEFIVRAQPRVIVIAQAEAARLQARPGWAALPALKGGAAGRVCALPPATMDALVRPGPRLVDAAAAVAACLRD